MCLNKNAPAELQLNRGKRGQKMNKVKNKKELKQHRDNAIHKIAITILFNY